MQKTDLYAGKYGSINVSIKDDALQTDTSLLIGAFNRFNSV